MVSDFMGDLIAAMREFAGLEQDELAEGLGVTTRTVQRMEKNQRETAIKREVERKIVEVTKVTKPRFAQILADVAGRHLGVRLVVLPPDTMVPSPYVRDAIWLFSKHGHNLDEKEWASIDSLLDEMRAHDVQAERLAKTLAKDIIRRINDGRIKRGEDPAAASED